MRATEGIKRLLVLEKLSSFVNQALGNAEYNKNNWSYALITLMADAALELSSPNKPRPFLEKEAQESYMKAYLYWNAHSQNVELSLKDVENVYRSVIAYYRNQPTLRLL